jgi:phage gp45-like
VHQIEYLGKTANCLLVFPYGLDANPGPDALTLLLAAQGASGAKLGIADDPQNRPKNLANGEVALYHPGSGSLLHFRESGDLDIDTIKGAQGNVNINADTVNLTVTNSVEVAGDLNVSGDFDVTGDTSLGANVTSNGKDISDTHAHIGSASAPSGPVTNTGVPV